MGWGGERKGWKYDFVYSTLDVSLYVAVCSRARSRLPASFAPHRSSASLLADPIFPSPQAFLQISSHVSMAVAVDFNCVVISGGGLEDDKEWIIKPSMLEERQGRRFIPVGRAGKWHQSLGNNFDMVDRLLELRNAQFEKIMYQAALSSGDIDPLYAAQGDGKLSGVKRKQAFQDADKDAILNLKVKCSSGEEVVYV